MFHNGKPKWGGWKVALNMAAKTLWHMPDSFGIARLLGPGYSLRCVIVHHVSDAESPFTKGLDVTITRSGFEAALKLVLSTLPMSMKLLYRTGR